MKNKPTRHKEANTFKFKPFSERICDIDVDVFHRVAHRNEDDNEDIETYFHQALKKWSLLNLTENYGSFKKEVRDIITLPQLLNKKQHVINTLLKYLEKKDVLCLQPILELVVAVARDLQKEFYEYFPDFLAVIIDLLQTKNTEQLEYAFTTLAYLFKFLWRYLIKNVGTVFDLLLPLLADSRPVYVNNFAAESFAFVVRKVRDKDAFLKLVLEALESRKDRVPGCGKLLFEVVSGTPGQFHSCAEQMLLLYFGSLRDQTVNTETLYEVCERIVDCALSAIHPQKSSIFWNVLLKLLDQFTEKCDETEKLLEKDDSLCFLLKLLLRVINYKDGRMLIDPVSLVKKLIHVIDIAENTENVLNEAVVLATAILLASNVKLAQETASHLVLKILSIKNTELLFKTVEQLVHYSSFETLILSHILHDYMNKELDSRTLRLFASIIKEKATPSLSGVSLHKWNKFSLDIRRASAESLNYLETTLNVLSGDNIPDNALRTLVILPHLNPLPKKYEDILLEGIVSIYKKLLESDDNDGTREFDKLTFSLLLAIDSAVHILEPDAFSHFIARFDIKLTALISKCKSNSNILNSIDLCLTHIDRSEQRKNYINKEMFDIMNECLAPLLGSPIQQIRLTVAHLYFLFGNVEELTLSDDDSEKNVLKLPFLAEGEPATVHKYRDRVQHLQALTFQSRMMCNLNPKYYDFPLYYLMGNLYINFSLLWDPVINIISTYAQKQCPQFWPIFLNELKFEGEVENPQEYVLGLFGCDVISALAIRTVESNEKPDRENYKLLLWKCMTSFPEFCEAKNRDLTGLFIDYVETNIFKSNSEDAKSCNIEKHKDNKKSDFNHLMKEGEEEKGEEEKEEIEEKAVGIASKPIKLQTNKTYQMKFLLAQMEMFSKMTNPKTLYREAEMYKIYLDLLSSKNPSIQKAALNCLLTYKHKFLLPYKEQLYNLVDEKNLKNELARFKIDQESNAVKEEHREGLVPILMRIIYTKMVMRTGMRTGGKAGGLARRTIILRFLAGSREDEMMIFAKMAFKLFHKYIPISSENCINLDALTRSIIDEIDLRNVIPPKRLQSSVNLLAIMIEQFGGKMNNKLLPRLLGILICILAQVTGISRRSQDVHIGYSPSIRNVRTSCIGVLARFFTHYENYEWTVDEINALFNVAVFPWLEKLPVEGIHSPTALLKLFMAWSQNPRYYPLFVKHLEGNVVITPLPNVMNLLLGPKTHASVVNAILEMVVKMLTLQDYDTKNEQPDQMEVEAKAPPLTPVVTNVLEVDQAARVGRINYGSAILLPHVPSILEYIKRKLKKPNRRVNRTELIILSRISELVPSAEACDTLLTLILPILVKRASSGASEDIILELVNTIINLMKNVKKPETHIRLIIPLISVVSSVPARKLLIQLFDTIAQGSTEDRRNVMIQNCSLLSALNAWDSKWIDQPDFQRRLDAFTEINASIEKGEIMLEFGIAIIHNCFYFLANEKDLALRDCSGQCLKTIGPLLARTYKENNMDRRYLVEDTILTIVRNGIRSKNEVVRLQSIAFLGQMAMECPDVHPILRDLSMLVNKVDPEVDFFENLQHLQLHRKARALLKFCTIAKTLKKPPNPKTLTQFILPLASSYLCNESFHNKNSIIDAAIETIGTICKLLPWHQYETILKYYLDKLKSSVEFQRQLIRVIVAILDAFHFDLSKYKALESPNVSTEKSSEVESDIESAIKESENTDIVEEDLEENRESEEKLDEELDNDTETNDEEIGQKEKEEAEKDVLPAMQKQTVLSQSSAKRVVFGISKVLLPQLDRSIMARTRHEDSHKINRRKTGAEREEEELMRVPIALAVVKLLQKLPESMLDKNLPGILMKLCTFLKSRLDSVRRAAREILQKVMVTLGPDYLHHLLYEMNSLLTRGFQVHVLVYTIHAVLISLKPHFKPLHINQNLQSILSVCKVDLFGLTAEEKEVAGIVRNVSEAKSTKSFDIFHILAQFITESCLLDLVMPVKEVLVKTHSYKIVRKAVECLRQIVLGLADNTFIPTNQLLVFLYGVVSESIPGLMPIKDKKKITEKEAEAIARQKPDCFVIPAEPKSRMGVKATARITANTNAHVMVEFGLRLYHVLLKRDRISGTEFKLYLEPVVSVLRDCLKSQHVKLSTLALQCMNWILKMDLSSVKTLITEICASMFAILHKYAAAGLSKGDNFDLVMAAFKCMSVLVRDLKDFTISTEQLKILILYAEQDLHDSDKQATAFGLLKAIISRKMIVSEMHAVMEKVAMLSISSDLEHVRQQSRSVFYMYLMEYPLGKLLEKHVLFYLTQLSYEVQPGRLSALEMIYSIVTGFPKEVLSKQSGLIFLMVGARLVNDDDPTCRKLCAKCIKEMVIRVVHNQKTKLFEIVLLWMKDSKISHRRLAVQLCGIFVTVEKEAFRSRLAEVLPLILKQFQIENSKESEPGRFVKLRKEKEDPFTTNPKSESLERMKDHHLFQVLQLLLKISANCTVFLNDKKYENDVRLFAECSQALLAHPHLWVRLAASQFIGFVLAALNVDEVAELLKTPDNYFPERGYIYSDTVGTIKSLTLDLIAQLQPNMCFEELADQVVKNLVFIAKVVKSAKFDKEGIKDEAESKDKYKDEISLPWFAKRMRKVINMEVTQNPKSTSMRTAVFKWFAGIVATISIEYLEPILFHIMSPLVREMATTEESNLPLRRMAKEITTMIKKRLDTEKYARLLNSVQLRLDTRKAERKKIRSQQLVTDPEVAAKRKIARQQRKKEAKKRKLDGLKGRKVPRKKPRKEVDLDVL